MVARKGSAKQPAGKTERFTLGTSPSLLPGEDRSPYKKLVHDIFAQINPSSPIEKILVGGVIFYLCAGRQASGPRVTLLKDNFAGRI